MDELITVGVFAARTVGNASRKVLHLQLHRVHSGEQTITVTVPEEPADAGIDPDYLLNHSDGEALDNVAEVAVR